jgi:hypothetical protein
MSKWFPLLPATVLSICSFDPGLNITSGLIFTCKEDISNHILVFSLSILPLGCVSLISKTLISEIKLENLYGRMNPDAKIIITTEPVVNGSTSNTVAIKDLRFKPRRLFWNWELVDEKNKVLKRFLVERGTLIKEKGKVGLAIDQAILKQSNIVLEE